MIIYPAIDIKNKTVVRLKQGRFDQVTEYSADPLSVAQDWIADGAQWLHVIDLDGAQTGEMKNLDIIARLAQAVSVPIQCGGGIRSEAMIEQLLAKGVKRVVLGTRAITDQEFLKRALRRWGTDIAVSLDCLQGKITHSGWVTTTDLTARDYAGQLEQMGLRCLIYTDIARDGMLTGPNIPTLREVAQAVHIPVIASGGVKDIKDVRSLKQLEPLGVAGIITGKAIYEGTLDLKEALAVCSQNA